MDINKRLEECRNEINEIDAEFLKLFIKRMKVAGEIGDLKAMAGLPVYNAKREAFVKERAVNAAPEDLQKYVSSLYDSVFEISRKYQKDKGQKENEI